MCTSNKYILFVTGMPGFEFNEQKNPGPQIILLDQHFAVLLLTETEVLSADSMDPDSCSARARIFARQLFPGTSAPRALKVQQQVGFNCGLFALAFCEASCRGVDLENLALDENKMREHLLLAFLEKTPALRVFPAIVI